MAAKMRDENRIQGFHLAAGLLRGRFARLSGVLDEILGRHDYPVPVAKILSETLVTGAALASMLKYDGRFTLQARGDGAIRLLVADTMPEGGIRAYAQFDAAEVARMGDEGIGLLGQGHIAFTVEPPPESGRERYQGIVALRGKTIAAATQNYFRQSEQIPTGIISVAQQDEAGHFHAACLLLQQMPQADTLQPPHDMSTADYWQHVMVLMSSCTAKEMLDPELPAERLLYRLFHAETLAIDDSQTLHHSCGCATRITDALRLFPREEVAEMAENGIVTMTCQFCSRIYRYDEAAIALIFGDPQPR
jgi:molecular chaperone Hsp33